MSLRRSGHQSPRQPNLAERLVSRPRVGLPRTRPPASRKAPSVATGSRPFLPPEPTFASAGRARRAAPKYGLRGGKATCRSSSVPAGATSVLRRCWTGTVPIQQGLRWLLSRSRLPVLPTGRATGATDATGAGQRGSTWPRRRPPRRPHANGFSSRRRRWRSTFCLSPSVQEAPPGAPPATALPGGAAVSVAPERILRL